MLEVGSVFAGRYKILDILGQGGMGAVYKAEDLKLNETIALKMLLPDYQDQPEVIKRFIREIRLALKITHENVVRIYDLGEIDKAHYISMEYIDGLDLKTLVERKTMFPTDEGVAVVRQVLSGLAVAHAKGIVHRDIKPQNIIITDEKIAKIVDFGIAKVAIGNQTKTAGMTKKDMIIGTPEYMSPEQALARKVDARTDIYALGIVMFEMFTGQPPFASDTAINLLIKQVKQQPPEPRGINPKIPPKLSRIILKALAKDPNDRFQSVNEMINALDNLSSDSPGPMVLEVIDQVDESGATSMNAFEVLEEIVEELDEEVDSQDDVKSLFTRGMEIFKQRQFSKALSFFHKVLELDPTHAQAYDYIEIAGKQIAMEANINRLLSLGESAFLKENYGEALKSYEQALSISPDNPAAQIGVKKTRAVYTPTESLPQTTAQPQAQSQALPVVMVTDTDDLGVMFKQGKQLYDEKQFAEAFEIFQTIMSKDSNYPQAYEYLEQAKAAQATQQEIEHHFLTARRLLEEEDLEACQQELAIALDFNPEHDDSLQLLIKLRLVAADESILQEITTPSSVAPTVVDGTSGAKTGAAALKQDPEFVEFSAKIKKLMKGHYYDEVLEELDNGGTRFPQLAEKLDEQKKRVRIEKVKYLYRDSMLKGEKFYKIKKYHQAVASFKKALELEPQSQQAQQFINECRSRISEERTIKDQKTQMKASRKTYKSEFDISSVSRGSRKSVFFYVFLFVLVAGLIGGATIMRPQIKSWLAQHFEGRGKVFYNQKQFAKAASSFQRSYDFEPYPEILEKLGEAHFYAANYAEAQFVFKQLIAEKGDAGKYNYYLGQIAVKTGKTEQAKESYIKALKENPNDESIHSGLGMIYHEEENYSRAIKHLKASLNIKSNQPSVRIQLARAYARSRDYSSAAYHYQKLIKDNPDYDVPYNELGRIYINQGSYGLAISILKKHPALNAGNAELYYNLGLCYENRARSKKGSDWVSSVDAAIEYYKKSFIVDMKHEDVVHRLVKLLKARRKSDYAIQIYNQYLGENPDDAKAHVKLAELYQPSKKYSQAFEHLNRAIQIDDSDYETWNKLGYLHLKGGGKQEAKNAFRKSLAIKPNQSKIKAKLRSL